MAEGAVEPSKVILRGRIEFHPVRRPFSFAGGDPRTESLNPIPGSHRPAARSSAASSAASGRRSDCGEFHQRVLDPELSFEITFRRIGAGLANLGNTCFLNSVLQCLTYTEPFAAYLQSGKHKSSCHTAGFCAMCALQNHVMDALRSTGKILRPFHLVKNLRCISRNFRNSRQEDAHEYMVNLLESMHKCCLPSGIASESPSAYEKSLVHKIFGGRLRSQVKCLQCSYCSNKFDPFLDLSLEIVKADNLHKALSHFTAVEQLDGGERQYQCQRCKQKVRAVKQLTIHKAPYVLTVHLKRFGSALPGQKINKKVDFEATLDLKRYVSDPCEGDLKYTLYGVLVHAGYATHSGHYYCFVRTSSGMWYSLNDDEVFQVSEKTVLQQKAYMLFYVRNTRSSGPRRALDIVCKEKMLANASGSKDLPVCSLDSKKASVGCPRENGQKKAFQECPRESGSKQYNPNPRTATNPLTVSIPLKDISVEEQLLKKTSILPCLLGKDGQKSALSKDCVFHSSSEVSSIKEPLPTISLLSSGTGKNFAADGCMEKASSGDDCNQLFGKDLEQSHLSKEKSVCSVSCVLIQSASASRNLIAANSRVVDCRVALASGQSTYLKDDVTTDSTVGVDKSNILVMHHAEGNTILTPASDNILGACSLVQDCNAAPASAQSSHRKDGPAAGSIVDIDKSKIRMHHSKGNVNLNPDPEKVLTGGPMCEEHDAQNVNVRVNGKSCKAHSFQEHGCATLANHSSDICSLKDPVVQVPCQKHDAQNVNMRVNGKSCKAHSFQEHGRATLANHSSDICSLKDPVVQVPCQDASVNDGKSKGLVVAKALKNVSKESGQGARHTRFDKLAMNVKKHSHIRKAKFGPGQFFLAYLNVMKKNVKKKKHRRIKKRCSIIKSKKAYGTLENSIQIDQGTSASTKIDMIDVCLVTSSKKKTCKTSQTKNGTAIDADVVRSAKKCSSLGRENGHFGTGDVNIINTDSSSPKDSDCGKRYGENSAKTRTSLKSEGWHSPGESCTHSNSHHVSWNLISRSKEVTVAPWYDRDSLPGTASISDHEPKNIGYMLDEWAKGNDRGRKKKIKRSRRLFGGGSHFWDIAAVRTQKKMKMDRTSSGNQPFRIHS